jgi:hypothetical protein
MYSVFLCPRPYLIDYVKVRDYFSRGQCRYLVSRREVGSGEAGCLSVRVAVAYFNSM